MHIDKKVLAIRMEVTPAELAGMLAHADSSEQAEFFNVFREKLEEACKDGFVGMGMQLLYILEGLNSETEALFAYLSREVNDQRKPA